MIREIASQQKVSESYLAKIFQNLAKTDIIDSNRGKYGGYRLARSPREISLGDIVRTLDGDIGDYACEAKTRDCPLAAEDCFLPEIFREARRRMFGVLDQVTLEDLALRVNDLRQRVRMGWIERNNQENASAN